MNEQDIVKTAATQGVPNMKTRINDSYDAKIYLQGRKRPIELTGLTKEEVNNFGSNAAAKMFVKYGPVCIRTESINYIIFTESK